MASVLAFDGDELIIDTLQDILGTFGHTVEAVFTSEAALAAVETRRWDILLVDILLPGLDAPDLTRRVLEKQPSIRVVAVTMYPKDEVAQAVLKVGAHSLMRKPYEVGKLLAILDEGPRP